MQYVSGNDNQYWWVAYVEKRCCTLSYFYWCFSSFWSIVMNLDVVLFRFFKKIFCRGPFCWSKALILRMLKFVINFQQTKYLFCKSLLTRSRRRTSFWISESSFPECFKTSWAVWWALDKSLLYTLVNVWFKVFILIPNNSAWMCLEF